MSGPVPEFALSHELARFGALRRQLSAACEEIEDEELIAAIAPMTRLPKMLAEIVRSALLDEALIAGLKLRLAEMKERQGRLEARAHRKRELVGAAMERAELNRLQEPDFTASLRVKPPAVLVSSEDDIPESYWVPQPPRLDRQAISQDLKAGVLVPGAELDGPASALTVRVK